MKQDLANRILSAATSSLGETVTYNRAGTDYQIKAIFSEMFSDIDVDTGLRITTEQPSLILNLSDLPTEPRGNDVVTVADGREFSVRETRPDGEGGMTLLLYEKKTGSYM